MEKRTSKDTPREEKEEEDDDDTDVDAACAPDVSPSSSSPSPTTAYIVPSNNDMHVVTYGLIVDDRIVDSTVVKEEREVLVADSSSSYADRKGTVEEGEEKQKGDPDS
jgi:hypothetical protein